MIRIAAMQRFGWRREFKPGYYSARSSLCGQRIIEAIAMKNPGIANADSGKDAPR